MSERKEMSTEMRSLIAAVLCLLVIAAWSLIYKPSPPVKQPAPSTAAKAPAAASPSPAPAAAPATAPKPAPQAVPVAPPAAASSEQTIVVESGLYRITLSNRGGVVHSWLLRKYTDDHVPPRTLDVVHPDAAEQTGGWPFSVKLNDASEQSKINNALFEITTSQPGQTKLQAPAHVTFHWSDGHLDVTKRLTFDASYVVHVDTTVRKDGEPLQPALAWRGGFGDITAYRAAQQTEVFTSAQDKLSTLGAKNLGKHGDTQVPATLDGPFSFLGIQDHYFAATFLPPLTPQGNPAQAPLTLTGWTAKHEIVNTGGKTETETLLQMAVGLPAPGPLDIRVYVGPKSVETLQTVRPSLASLVQFGWWGFIAQPLYYALRWIYRYVPNYGWAIVLITIAINMVMFPLKVKSMRAMFKMQQVSPEIKSIQERYKKYSMRDPRKAEMNKEVMAVYQREGINPLGSCWPTLLQMPIWFGLYRMLENVIQLRHAPWIEWIHDLSARDPYFILPITMAITMYIMQKMTPTPGMDPAQARMMGLTPLIFGGMFMLSPSGLTLYILASNIVGIGQQWYLYRTQPPPPKPLRGRAKKQKEKEKNAAPAERANA